MFPGVLSNLVEGGQKGAELHDFGNPTADDGLLDVLPLDHEEVMLVIRPADRRFEPPRGRLCTVG